MVTCCANFFMARKYGRNKVIWGLLGIVFPVISNFILMFSGYLEKKEDIDEANEKSINKNKISDTILNSNISIKISGKRFPLFIDVETTGLHSNDSVVSLCMILLYCDQTEMSGKLTFKKLHYIFDPCKKSHPIAEKIHGYDDWTLRHQDLFIEKIKEIQDLINECDLIVAHNVKFDISFLSREFQKCGIKFPDIDTICTMEETIGASSLQACAKDIGLYRAREIHDAGEDTKLVMCVYLKRRSNIDIQSLFEKMFIPIENYTKPPPQPDGPLPRRNNIQKKKDIMEKISQMPPVIES